MFADGSVQTPVLPDGFLENIAMEDRTEREQVRDTLKSIIKRMDIRVSPLPEPERSLDSSKALLDRLYQHDLQLDAKRNI